MRTQGGQGLRPPRGPIAGISLALAVLLAPATAAARGEGAYAAAAGGPSAGLLLGAATLLLLAAALIGYGVPARHRRHAQHGLAPTRSRPPAPVFAPASPKRTGGADLAPPDADRRAPVRDSRENDLTQTTRPTTETGDTPTEPVARRPGPATDTGKERALGYTTFRERRRAVSPESRYQARRIRAACEARGMVLHQLVGDVQSYSGPDLERPGLNHALEQLAAGEASCLVVAGLDRLSRSAANLGTVIEWLDEVDARLVVLDIDLDTHTDEGRLAARALARVGALDRRSGAESVREPPRSPEHGRGRPAVADLPLLQRRIATMRASGMTLQGIADTLNKEGVPTLRGGAKWRPSSVQAATGYKRPSRHSTEPEPAVREDDG